MSWAVDPMQAPCTGVVLILKQECKNHPWEIPCMSEGCIMPPPPPPPSVGPVAEMYACVYQNRSTIFFHRQVIPFDTAFIFCEEVHVTGTFSRF